MGALMLPIGLTALLLGFLVLGSTQGEAAGPGPRVVCIQEYGNHPTGSYKYRPRKCVLHHRGVYPVAGYNTSPMGHLRWRYWRSGSAMARGKLFISTYGPAPAKLKLMKPRSPCGEKVFTKASIKFKVHSDGKTHKNSFKLPLDDCLT